MNVTAIIDISTPTGRQLVRELEIHNRVVKLTYPKAEGIPEGAVSLEEGIDEFWNHLEDRFGFDLRKYEEV